MSGTPETDLSKSRATVPSLEKYRYNAEGLRDEIEGQRRTTWVNGFAYLDKTIANTFLAKYETQAHGRSPAIAITPSGNEYLQSDALGSTTLSTSATGAVNATTTFDAFGNSITQGASNNKFGYTGHETDRNTGLIYFKARHYDPELGRFISADPYEGEPNAPVSWNSYLYANSNPLFYIDRNGYYSWSEFGDDALSFGTGVAKGAGAFVYETLATTYDLEQVAAATATSWATGKVQDVQYTSALGNAARGGARTSDILIGGAKAALQTPGRLGSALGQGNAEAAGEEAFNLGLLLAPGAKTGASATRNVATGLAREGAAGVKSAVVNAATNTEKALVQTAQQVKAFAENTVEKAQTVVSEVRGRLTGESGGLGMASQGGFVERSVPAQLSAEGANSAAPFSPIVEGGGLQAYENAGGHLLQKHVGQSEQALMNRLVAEPKITGSSSFYDRATAESAMSQTLDANTTTISNWLNGSAGRLRLDYSLPDPVGISVSRGAAGAVDVNSVRTILVHDPSMPTGYKIITGFPTKP